MKRFLIRLSVFGLVFVAVASATDWVVSAGLRESKRQPFSTWNDIYQSRIDADVIVTGSSRAYVHVSPAILEDVTQLRTYNLGFNGYFLPMQRMRFNEYLANNRAPRIVVQTVDTMNFQRRAELYRYEQFLPYFHKPAIVEALSDYNGYHPLDRWLPMFRYRGRTGLVQSGLEILVNPHEQYDTDRGYRANDLPWNGSFEKFRNRNTDGFTATIKPEIVEMLDSFVADLLKKEILPVLVFTPEYIEAQRLCRNRYQVIQYFEQIATKYAIAFLDYSKNAMCEDRSLFYNSQHLNQMGSERFSRILAQDLARLLEQRN